MLMQSSKISDKYADLLKKNQEETYRFEQAWALQFGPKKLDIDSNLKDFNHETARKYRDMRCAQAELSGFEACYALACTEMLRAKCMPEESADLYEND